MSSLKIIASTKKTIQKKHQQVYTIYDHILTSSFFLFFFSTSQGKKVRFKIEKMKIL